MTLNWLYTKKDEFVTDILRNFCITQQQLTHEFRQYYQTQKINFEQLADLLGQEMNQGRLWRLKDSAHLLFRKFPDHTLSGKFLDWSIGYIFHECMKLKEDAYQLQNYVPWFQGVLDDSDLNQTERDTGHALYQLINQTQESIRREVERINFILDKCRLIFINYLPDHYENFLLARFIYNRNDMVREVFGDYYQDLILAVYGENPENLYLFAAQSFRQGGWWQKAQDALQEAININPDNTEVLHEKKLIANYLSNS
mgnify:CR=1 FL=1